MPRIPFDDLVRLFGAPDSRRGLLRLAGAGLLAGLTGNTAAAVATAARKKKSRKKPKKKSRCLKFGKICSKKQKCCRGTKCLRGLCQCPTSKKWCSGTCIPRTQCCPAVDGPCTLQPNPCGPTGVCCLPDEKPCGAGCIPNSHCCPGVDCVDECLTGACNAFGQCVRKDLGTLCGGGTRQCNSQGECAQTCEVHDDCPDPPDDTTPREFCLIGHCNDGVCETIPKSAFTELPAMFQIIGDCKVWECAAGLPDGVGFSSDKSILDTPPIEECRTGYCTDGLEPEFTNVPDGNSCLITTEGTCFGGVCEVV